MHPCQPQIQLSFDAIPSTTSPTPVGNSNSCGGTKVRPSTYVLSSLRCALHVSLWSSLMCRRTRVLGRPDSHVTQMDSSYSASYRIYRSIEFSIQVQRAWGRR